VSILLKANRFDGQTVDVRASCAGGLEFKS